MPAYRQALRINFSRVRLWVHYSHWWTVTHMSNLIRIKGTTTYTSEYNPALRMFPGKEILSSIHLWVTPVLHWYNCTDVNWVTSVEKWSNVAVNQATGLPYLWWRVLWYPLLRNMGFLEGVTPECDKWSALSLDDVRVKPSSYLKKNTHAHTR